MRVHAQQGIDAMTNVKYQEPDVVAEKAEQRVARLYATPGGPLIGWLYDECRRRGQDYRHMAEALGVTYGYINQLSQRAAASEADDEFAVSCARYWGASCGCQDDCRPHSDVRLRVPYESMEAVVNRSMALMLDNPVARYVLPADLSELSLEAKQSLIAMYVECSGRDLLGARQLPEVVRWLQRAASIHDESCGEAFRGHRDIAASY